MVWTDAARYDAALVFPADAPPDTLVVCTSGLANAGPLIRDVAAANWAARHDLGGGPPPTTPAWPKGWRPIRIRRPSDPWSRISNSFTVGGEGFQDLVGAFGSHERLRVLVPLVDPLADASFQLGDAAVR
jgi:hypothetical protein